MFELLTVRVVLVMVYGRETSESLLRRRRNPFGRATTKSLETTFVRSFREIGRQRPVTWSLGSPLKGFRPANDACRDMSKSSLSRRRTCAVDTGDAERSVRGIRTGRGPYVTAADAQWRGKDECLAGTLINHTASLAFYTPIRIKSYAAPVIDVFIVRLV